jgi:hypothetical protein
MTQIEGDKKKIKLEELEQENEKLKGDFEAEHNEMVSWRQKSDRLQSELSEMQDQMRDQKKKLNELELTNAKNSSKVLRLRIMDFEMRTNSIMRMIVIFTFAVIGPILLLIYLFNVAVAAVLLDIFKIWLGAAIGISTNLLQRNEKSERSTYPEEQESVTKKGEAQ